MSDKEENIMVILDKLINLSVFHRETGKLVTVVTIKEGFPLIKRDDGIYLSLDKKYIFYPLGNVREERKATKEDMKKRVIEML